MPDPCPHCTAGLVALSAVPGDLAYCPCPAGEARRAEVDREQEVERNREIREQARQERGDDHGDGDRA